jgi:hypothetical protein
LTTRLEHGRYVRVVVEILFLKDLGVFKMRDLFDKEFQKEMDDFFDYIDYEVLGKTKPEEDDDFLDKYCEEHPDFDEAMNGMVWEPEHLEDR